MEWYLVIIEQRISRDVPGRLGLDAHHLIDVNVDTRVLQGRSNQRIRLKFKALRKS